MSIQDDILDHCKHCTSPVEAKRYSMCFECWWNRDPRNVKNGGHFELKQYKNKDTRIQDDIKAVRKHLNYLFADHGPLNRILADFETLQRDRNELATNLEALLSLGRKDTSNPKYDGYYTEARAVLAKTRLVK